MRTMWTSGLVGLMMLAAVASAPAQVAPPYYPGGTYYPQAAMYYPTYYPQAGYYPTYYTAPTYYPIPMYYPGFYPPPRTTTLPPSVLKAAPAAAVTAPAPAEGPRPAPLASLKAQLEAMRPGWVPALKDWGAGVAADLAEWRPYGLAGVSVLRSHVGGRDAFVNINADGSSSGQEFDPGVRVAPVAVLGAMSPDGFGVRARFWYFREDDQRDTSNADAAGATRAVASALPAPFTVVSSAGGVGPGLPAGTGGGALAAGLAPDVIRAGYDLKLLSFDLEATRAAIWDDWTLIAGAGARYASLQQTYDFTRTNAGGSSGGLTFLTDAEASAARHRFEGAGPTAALDLFRAVGCGGLSLYGGGRGTLLVGRHEFDASTRTVVLADGLGGGIDVDTLQSGSSARTRVVPVGELELGAQWAHDVGAARLLARAGFQVQRWFDAGTLTGTHGNVDFYGGNFLLGLLY